MACHIPGFVVLQGHFFADFLFSVLSGVFLEKWEQRLIVILKYLLRLDIAEKGLEKFFFFLFLLALFFLDYGPQLLPVVPAP